MARKSDVNSIKFHKATRQAYYHVNGKRHYLGVWHNHPSKKLPAEISARFNLLKAQIHQSKVDAVEVSGPAGPVTPFPSPALPSGPITLAQLADQFFSWADSQYENPRTRENLENCIQPLLTLFLNEPVRSIGPRRLTEAQKLMVAQGRTRQGVLMATGYIRQMFAWGVSQELVKAEQLVAIRTVRPLKLGAYGAPESPPREAIPLETVQATLPHLSPTVAAMVRLQLFTGMRPGEVCVLSMPDIEQKDDDLWVYRPAKHKTAHIGRIRAIPLVPEAIAILRPFLRNDDKPLFSPAECRKAWEAGKRAKRKTKVQPSQQNRSRLAPLVSAGDQYSTMTYRRAIERAGERAGVGRWSPNRLRKLVAQQIADTLGLNEARAMLGHADAEVTRRHYAQKDLVQATIAAKAIAKQFSA